MKKTTLDFTAFKIPLIIMGFFYTIAITLTPLDGDGYFYLFNFTYIGTSIALGIFLIKALPIEKKFIVGYVSQLLVCGYMLIYLGLIFCENMQIEGFWVYFLEGVFAGATLHFLIAKIGGPLLFVRAWCGGPVVDGHGLRFSSL